jgi:release factor glutamine methyltransferase
VLALAGGVELYRRLAAQSSRWLRDGGTLAVEIDARLGDDVARVFAEMFVDVRVLRDLAGRDRVVLARAP